MPTKKARQPWEPWTDYITADVAAFQALERGEASPEQQKRALTILLHQFAGTYDLSFRPESERASAFAEGKRSVGLSVVKFLRLDLRTISRTDKGNPA